MVELAESMIFLTNLSAERWGNGAKAISIVPVDGTRLSFVSLILSAKSIAPVVIWSGKLQVGKCLVAAAPWQTEQSRIDAAHTNRIIIRS